MGTGVNEEFLKKTNEVLIDEDLVFLFDGERFLKSVEDGHKHEEDKLLMKAVRNAHQKLGQEYGWVLVASNRTKEEIFNEIMQRVEDFLKN